MSEKIINRRADAGYIIHDVEAEQIRNAAIEECARALEQEAGDQELIHLAFATQTIRALKDK